MKKETVIAIMLGIGLGVVVAVTVVLKNRQAQIQQAKPITTSLNVTPSPLIKNLNIEVLEITEPQNGNVVNANSIMIKGKVAKGSLVVIQSAIKNLVVKDAPEKLEVKFPLALGENIINIVAYPKDRQISSKEKKLQIYYLDEQ